MFQSQAEELGIDSKSMANMSKVELAMRSDDPSVLNSWQKKKGKGGGKVSVVLLCTCIPIVIVVCLIIWLGNINKVHFTLDELDYSSCLPASIQN